MGALYALHNPGKPVELKFGELELVAFSISGLATYVLAPAMDAVFDLGHCSAEAARARNVLLSHVHQDHSTGALRHASLRAMQSMRPSRVYAPAESADDLRALFRAMEKLEGRPPEDLEALVRPVSAGDEVKLAGPYVARAFDAVHRIASRGYTVLERRKKLRPEYVGLPHREIAEAAGRGATVHDEVELAAMTYVGDSTIETLRAHPELGKSEVLFLEATHVGKTPWEKATKYGHTHLGELEALWREQPEGALASPHIVLKHFSMKYTRDDIRRAVDALPEGLRERVTALV